MNTNQRITILFLLLISLLVSGCSTGQFFGPTATSTPTLTPTSTPLPTSTPTLTLTPTLTPTNTPVPTPTLPFIIPTPKAGRGTIWGQALHKGQPAANLDNVDVQLCSQFDTTTNFLFPCSGMKYRVSLNSYGYYIFSNVQPGGYEGIEFLLPGGWVDMFYRSDATRHYVVSVQVGQI